MCLGVCGDESSRVNSEGRERIQSVNEKFAVGNFHEIGLDFAAILRGSNLI